MKNESLRCKSQTQVFCDIDKSASFPDGICVNCGRVLMSARTVISKMTEHINLYSDNFELFSDLCDMLRENNITLPVQEIRNICTHWYKKSKATKERLSDADELFLMLTRVNPMSETIEKELGVKN